MTSLGSASREGCTVAAHRFVSGHRPPNISLQEASHMQAASWVPYMRPYKQYRAWRSRDDTQTDDQNNDHRGWSTAINCKQAVDQSNDQLQAGSRPG